jgi:hypothetical protein
VLEEQTKKEKQDFENNIFQLSPRSPIKKENSLAVKGQKFFEAKSCFHFSSSYINIFNL